MAHTHAIRIEPDGPCFAAPDDRPLLPSAEAAGLAWPSSCRNGTCRSCIQHLAQGRVTYRIEWPGLLAEEKAAGAILPCVAFPATDLVLRQMPSARENAGGSPDQSLPVG